MNTPTHHTKAQETICAYTGVRNDVIGVMRRPPKKIIDIGCSNGATVRKLKEKYEIQLCWGLEIDEAFAKEATEVFDQVIQADLNDFDFSSIPETFDTIILADVLEHLYDPRKALKCLIARSTTGAQFMISIPNVQHWTVLCNLILGRWPQRDRGIFDRTHIRWFTLSSLQDMLEHCDLSVEEIHRSYRILDQPGGRLNRFARVLAGYGFLPFVRSLLTYQYVVCAVRTPKPNSSDSVGSD